MRVLNLSDAPQLAALHAACFPSGENWSEQSFIDLLQQPEVFGWTIEDEAFLLGRVVAEEAELLTLVVMPAQRRQGKAQQLIKAFLSEATANRNAPEIFLEVADDNTAAQRLYTAMGFKQVGLRPDYYSGRRAALVLRYLSNV